MQVESWKFTKLNKKMKTNREKGLQEAIFASKLGKTDNFEKTSFSFNTYNFKKKREKNKNNNYNFGKRTYFEKKVFYISITLVNREERVNNGLEKRCFT